MSKFTLDDFKGVIPALITPFKENEELDEDALRELVRFLLKFEIGGLYVAGSTGETFLMSSDERKRVLEIVMEEVGDKVAVVAHIGAISTKASIELAEHAKQVGATAISSVPPFYWKFTEQAIVSFYNDIAESVDIPMIVYNLPLAGLMSVDTVKKLSEIKNVKGLKYTSTTLFELTQIRDKIDFDFKIYGGADEMASSNIALGCDGIIGSFYNLIPDLFIKIFETTKSNNIEQATKYQEDAVRIIMDVLKHGNMTAAMKAILRKAGINAGFARRPFINYEGSEVVNSLLNLCEKHNIKDIEILKLLRK